MTPDLEHRLDRLDRLARKMDAAFRIPGTGIRVGADSLIGLVPGVGDALTLVPAGWIIWEARDMGAPTPLLGRMVLNTGVDAIVGSIPLLGDLFDVGWKGNLRNVALLRDHVARQRERAAPMPGDGPLSSHHPTLGGSQAAPVQPTSSSPEKK